jgi:hypothetical protein
LRVGYADGGKDYLEEAGASEAGRGRLSIREADAAILFRLPVRHPFYTPYAVMGVGVRQYDAGGTLSPGADSAFAGGPASALAATVGLGAYVPFGKRFLLQLEAVRWVSPTPISGLVTGTVLTADSMRVVFQDPASATVDSGIDTVGGWRITVGVGLRVPLRGHAAEESPQEPEGSTSRSRDDDRAVPSTRSRTDSSTR